jgi:TetR/AcrR family transcriptional regulator, transcriptional repressor of aconitase
MPRISPARAQMRRRQIIDAALISFARHGFHKTTMQDIVKQSALSPGAIYCHFASKHDIIIALVEERHRREGESLRRALSAETFASAVAALVSDFIAVLGTADERAWRRLTIQLWAESLHDRRLAVAVRQGVDEPRVMLANMIGRARASGELPHSLNDDAMARLLIACFQGLVLQQAWDAGVDATACANALATLIASQRKLDNSRRGPRPKVAPAHDVAASTQRGRGAKS